MCPWAARLPAKEVAILIRPLVLALSWTGSRTLDFVLSLPYLGWVTPRHLPTGFCLEPVILGLSGVEAWVSHPAAMGAIAVHDWPPQAAFSLKWLWNPAPGQAAK
jgi:hypothetical protein